jgi:hypothetical protein
MTGHAGGRRRAGRRAEDRSRSANMRVHARLGDPKETRDLFRRKTAGHGTQYLTLTIGQPGD